MDTRARELTPQQIEIMRDFGQLVIDELELRLLASTDSLTGAMSRSYFLAEAAREIGRASNSNKPLSCAQIDIDHLKSINDTHGHGVGDLVLQRVIATCKAELRQTDCIGRIGGEEFAVLMPDAPLECAMEIIERMRKTVAALVVSEAQKAGRCYHQCWTGISNV